jgi:hypothetical protein
MKTSKDVTEAIGPILDDFQGMPLDTMMQGLIATAISVLISQGCSFNQSKEFIRITLKAATMATMFKTELRCWHENQSVQPQ